MTIAATHHSGYPRRALASFATPSSSLTRMVLVIYSESLSELDTHLLCQHFTRPVLKFIDLIICQAPLHAAVGNAVAMACTLLQDQHKVSEGVQIFSIGGGWDQPHHPDPIYCSTPVASWPTAQLIIQTNQ